MKHARPDYNRIQDPEFKIPVNEPVFLIRGQDKIAPHILREYATANIKAGGNQDISESVLVHAHLMEEWQKNKQSKLADMPYNAAHVTTALDLILAERQRQIEQFGFTDEFTRDHPEFYQEGQLSKAAAAFLVHDRIDGSVMWPWSDESFHPVPGDRLWELAKAASMIINEMTRIIHMENLDEQDI